MENKIINILLVDDDPGDCRLVELALSPFRGNGEEQFDIKTAETLCAAKDRLKAENFDAILLDLGLPDSQGCETVREVLELDLRLPIIVFTGLANEAVGLRAIKQGASDYIVKDHFSGDVLRRSIRYAIERKRIENKLVEANERLKEHDRLKSEFVTTVSHELRTPLSIFKNIISNTTAGTYGKISTELRGNLELADKSVDRLARIISDFLDISKIEAGQVKPNFDRFDIKSLIKKTMQEFTPLTSIGNIKLKAIMPDDTLFVDADHDMISRVLINLVSNAIKFVSKNGHITIRAKAVDREIVVEVEDNGPGIAANDVDKIFNRFVQINRMVGADSHGTGLGLSISKELIEMNGGRIWAESTPGSGSIFCFAVPKCGQDSDCKKDSADNYQQTSKES